LGDLDGAAEALANCISLKPDYAQALFALGLLEKKRGHADESLAAFQRAVESDPKHAPAQLSLGIALLEGGQVDAAVEHMQRAVQLAPDDPVPRGYLKKAEEKQGE
jgi:tetratricopeptide (TPR) repeat protein